MVKSKIAEILEMANHRAKQSDVRNLQVLVQHIWGLFDLVVFKVILSYSVQNCLQLTNAGRRVKWIKVQDPGILVVHIQGSLIGPNLGKSAPTDLKITLTFSRSKVPMCIVHISTLYPDQKFPYAFYIYQAIKFSSVSL